MLLMWIMHAKLLWAICINSCQNKFVCPCVWRRNREHSTGPESITLSIHMYTQTSYLLSLCAAVTSYLLLAEAIAHRVHFQQHSGTLQSLFLWHNWHLFLLCWPCMLLSWTPLCLIGLVQWGKISQDPLHLRCLILSQCLRWALHSICPGPLVCVCVRVCVFLCACLCVSVLASNTVAYC